MKIKTLALIDEFVIKTALESIIKKKKFKNLEVIMYILIMKIDLEIKLVLQLLQRC